MSVRELLLAVVLLAASTLVVTGAALISTPIAVVLSGILLAGLGLLFLAETRE